MRHKTVRKKRLLQYHVETILKEARIGKGTFYLYFKNKEELFISNPVKFLDVGAGGPGSIIELAQKRYSWILQGPCCPQLKFFKEP
jgi:tRNA G46 methylase TrmB